MGEHKRPRRRSAYRQALAQELRAGLLLGLVLAGFYCLFALGIYAFRGSRPFEANDATLGSVLGAYLASGVLGGLAYGFMHPLRRSLLGVMLIGIVCATLAFFAIVVATSGLPTRWSTREWENVVVLGLLFGPVCGFIAHKQGWRGR
jgi:hypothetical protein